LSYVSKNYYIISANPNDPQSYPLFQQAQVLGKDCAKDGSGQRFFQRFDAAIPCYSNSNAKLAQGTAVFDEKINSPILVSSVYLKTKVISNVCQDGTISKPNNQIQIHQFTQLNHYHDINGNNSFDGYGVDSKISQLQNGSTDTNILTDNNADTKVDCSNPDFRIRAIEPNTNACFTDSPYTGSPQIALDFLHVGSYNEFRVRREATPLDTNQWTAWQPLAAANVSGCSSNPTNIFKDLNFQNRDKGLKNVGVQFGNKVGGADIEGPTLFDDIVYGYPWISTFRGDVHTNGELDGEASSLPPLSAFSQYSHYSCNPPNARFNADYVVSAVNGLQVISGVDSGNICKNGEEATPFNTLLQLNPSVSPGTLVGPDAQGLVNAIADLNLQAMSSIATMVCAGDITVTSNGSIVGGANGCSPQNQQLLSAGNLVFVQGAITVGNGETVLFRNSGNPSDSAAYTFVATDGIHVEDNVEYENGASQLSSSRQLASVAFLSNGNIDISESVNHLAGIYFTKGTLSTSNNPTAPKLSLYGSLVADKIDFNRNWLGPTQ
jgi:hypothetical protein